MLSAITKQEIKKYLPLNSIVTKLFFKKLIFMKSVKVCDNIAAYITHMRTYITCKKEKKSIPF